ncbi:O-methyltransferase [Ichthyenterobacterium magnum]|uniref:O-methyltransferase n=1 Tax=Ichthyenterobacterium magnum TaxID=1230530 RepID=UPI001FE99355|nr:class I SAM-dependent methyltransferase [Ichthyenterobacterium magnum]
MNLSHVYQIIEYIKFLFKSTNQHGVHSPFVYHLITKCFYDKYNYPEYSALKKYREALYKNHKTITVNDTGAGSRTFKSNSRKISQIAKTAGTSSKRVRLLYRLVNYLSIKQILELGTSVGLGTSALRYGKKVITIEACQETSNVAQQNLNSNTIDFRVNTFEKELPLLKDKIFDLVFIDGNHQKEATLSYFNQLIEQTHNDSVFIFDDIHWSKEMAEAWEIIKQHHKVTLTIDTFFWGFVFFRKEQAKEHFIVRV